MSEMYPEKPLVPDEMLAHLQDELYQAFQEGGQEAVDGVWAGVEERYTNTMAVDGIDALSPDDDIVSAAEAITVYSVVAADNIHRALARLFFRLGPPSAELFTQNRKPQEDQE